MKNYEKPSVDFQSIVSFEKLSNLSDWLEMQGEEFTDAGITTYLIESKEVTAMKRILALILALCVCLSFSLTAFGAVTGVVNFIDYETGYSYLFGKFSEGDTNAGFKINGKIYDLNQADVNDPSQTAFEKANATDSKAFGIGFLDLKDRETLEATPYWVNSEGVEEFGEVVSIVKPDYDNVLLKDIQIAGETIAAFSPYKSYYYYDTEEVITKDDIMATAQAAYAEVTVAEAENNKFVITTTAPGAEEAGTVEIIVRKPSYQLPSAQSASLTGFKRINIVNLNETGAKAQLGYVNGSSSIYDPADTIYLKASVGGSIVNNEDSNYYGLMLAQFDISNVTAVNNRVYLEVPAKKATYNGTIGAIEVKEELPIIANYNNVGAGKNTVYYNGKNTTAEYPLAIEDLKTLPDEPQVVSKENIGYVKNAIAMVDVNSLDKEISPRALVDSADFEVVKLDVTDYVKKRVAEGSDTVTIGIRGFETEGQLNETQMYVTMRAAYYLTQLTFDYYDADLDSLEVDGKTITGFDKDTTYYNYGVDNSLTTAPSVTYTLSDSEASAEIINNETSIPGKTTVRVTSKDGYVKDYVINFGYNAPYERASFTYKAIAKFEREPSKGNIAEPFNRYVLYYDGNTSNNVGGRTYNTTGIPRDQMMLIFDTDAIGFEEGHQLLLSMDMYGNATGNGAKVKIVGVESEDFVYDSNEKMYNLPLRSTTYVATCDTTLSETTKEFVYDVTDYVKEKVANGNSQISFFVEVDSTKSGVNYTIKAKTPKMSYVEMDKTLTDIKIDGESLKGFATDVYSYEYTLDANTTVDTLPEITGVLGELAASQDATVVVTMPEQIPGNATVTVLAADKTSVEYTIALRLPFEQGEFTFDFNSTKEVEVVWGSTNKVSAIKTVGESHWFRQYLGANHIYVPRQSIMVVFNTTAEGLNDDDKVTLNFTVNGSADTEAPNPIPGGKVKVIYSSEEYAVNAIIDDSLSVVSSNSIAPGYTNFSIDISELCKQALKDATAVDGIKTVKFLLEVDPTGYPTNDDITAFKYSDTHTSTNLGGFMQFGAAYTPSITYAE